MTWISRVRAQVRRNAREHPKVRRRREAAQRAARYAASRQSMSSIHYATAATHVETTEKAIREALLGKSSVIILRHSGEGGLYAMYEQMRAQLDRDITLAILGRDVVL